MALNNPYKAFFILALASLGISIYGEASNLQKVAGKKKSEQQTTGRSGTAANDMGYGRERGYGDKSMGY